MISRDVTLIIKVTNACNMHCQYCFIEPSVFHKAMTVDTAKRTIRAFLDSEYFRSVNFVWHGGEPLLRGRRFFEELLEEQSKKPTQVAYTNSTQTNATHLSNEMLDFLIANQFQIGLSLDGPGASNDNVRKMRLRSDGRSAYEVTVEAARRLQERGRAAAAIVAVNRNNMNDAEAIYRDFSARRIHMKINPLTRSGLAASGEGDALGIAAEEYGDFLVCMFDLWFDDPKPTITIEPIAQHIDRILGSETVHSCFYTQHCHHFFLGISPDGDLYPCGMFQGEPSFKYGNIHDMAPEDVGSTLLFGKLEERERKVLKQCAKCAFLDLCFSGCMFHSLKDAKVLEEKDYFCVGYKKYFEHVLRRLHTDLSQTALSSVC